MRLKFMKTILKGSCLIVILLPLLLLGCDSEYTPAKEFLFQHPAIKLQLGKQGDLFDKYTPSGFFKSLNKEGEILIIYIGDQTYEIFLKDGEHRIGETNYYVKLNCF